ncbi:MAG: hypothetical protein QOE41_2343 [Mycobacterium sp.]|jgi:hypothetical protein|nr:hypothetical protein [Mycobacterium sp.]MDT5133032.1 hypothetical protein [Mycobacterium sp.]
MGESRRQQGGPPLVLVGGLSAGLFIAGLVISALLGGVTPSPFGAAAMVVQYYRDHPAAVRAGAIFVFASSVPLLLYASTASARLRQLGVTAPGATIALAGGIAASAAVSLSGLLAWTLSRSDVSSNTAVVRGISTLSFLLGGPAHVVPLGLLVAGIAVPSLIIGLLPGPVAWAGLVIAVVCELSTLALVSPALAILLPIARFPALIWLVVAGVLLPRQRTRAHTAGNRAGAAAERTLR